MHVHGVYKYFYVDFDEANAGRLSAADVEAYVNRFAASINRAVSVSFRNGEGADGGGGGTSAEHVYKVVVTQGRPYYGYCPGEKYYLKVCRWRACAS